MINFVKILAVIAVVSSLAYAVVVPGVTVEISPSGTFVYFVNKTYHNYTIEWQAMCNDGSTKSGISDVPARVNADSKSEGMYVCANERGISSFVITDFATY